MGKRRVNHAKDNYIGNKMKRQEEYKKQKVIKLKAKKAKRKENKRLEELGEVVVKPVQKTLDDLREADETMVDPEDVEVAREEAMDEFSAFFKGEKHPKILITTSYRATKLCFDFIRDLLYTIPKSYYYDRKGFALKRIIEAAKKKDFTYIMVINQDRKELNSMLLIHLPVGPTAFFKMSNVVLGRDIPNRAKVTKHKPEVILNNFNTRLGHRVGRMLGALFHQEPNFHGRRVVTFHNQRDYIFLRHHRYVFDSAKVARLQEIGPQFTLKLEWLQAGTFDTEHGQYEWKYHNHMNSSRRRFHL